MAKKPLPYVLRITHPEWLELELLAPSVERNDRTGELLIIEDTENLAGGVWLWHHIRRCGIPK
jgi:hypothetical protein